MTARICVTGACGFIGSHLAEALVQRGADVTALVLYNSFDSCGWLDASGLRGDMRIVRGDVRDAEQMRGVLKGQDVVFHLAALISVPYSYETPRSHIDTNVTGTMNVLAASADAQRVVVTSTSEVYGSAQYTPMDEGHPINPRSPYAASKVGADAMAKAFHASYRNPVVTLRPFNTYGPRQSERAVIGTVIRQMLDGECGSVKLGDGSPKRDLMYVSDTVEAFIAASALPKEAEGQVYNAGTGEMVTIEELANLIVKSRKPLSFDVTRVRPKTSEVTALCCNAGKLMKASQWRPRVSLAEGLERTVEWWRSRIEHARPTAAYVT